MIVTFAYRCHGPEGRFRVKSFSQTAPQTWCCPRLRDEFGGGLIDLAMVGFPRPENVIVVLCTANFMTNGDIIRAVTPISNCPFCGERIATQGRQEGEPQKQIKLAVLDPNS